ncbi:immunity protein TriTu family protein [Thermomonas carbonis]|uniref:Uncharacterized protein n=1 Tax=Thermomonas carbonis TaxID=1463158 RepID=A0A7G9SNN1_9GAMM|nr:hypothetical protein [Thermomonas carbonis]QNN69456.1 hypothetical protein H9L16_12325 [Thermomonas carbonis]GHB93238.1 hypothetical protein GCM10010080_00030 [Thermomonas carbonis]
MENSSQLLIESRTADCVVVALTAPCEITYTEPSDNPAVRFDFDSPHAVARFTWWSDSSYVSESLALDGRQIVSAQGFAVNSSDATAAIEALLAASEIANAT